MAQKQPGEGGLCGAHHSGGASFRTSRPSVDREILSFSGLRDSAGTAPNGTGLHTAPKPAHWSDPSHGPPREEDPEQSEELSREGGWIPRGWEPLFSIPSAGNCQGTPGLPEGPYSEGGDGSSSNFCHHCTSPTLGKNEELEEEYDDEEPLKFPSDFSRVSSGKKPPPRRQRHRFPTKEDNREDPRSRGRHHLADKRRGLGLWGAEELCQLGQAGFWWLIELLVLVGEYVEMCGHLIYACRQLKGIWVGVWAGRLRGWGHVGFSCGAGVFTHFLRLLSTFLLLALALFLGCLQLGWQFVVGLGDWLGWRDKVTWLDSPQLVILVQWTWLELPWAKQRADRQGNAPVASGRYCQPEEEVVRLLIMVGVPEDELNPFHALRVEATASDLELKKAYRRLAVMVHPDKNHHPPAEEAFKVLHSAWDIVSNPESQSVNEFLSKLQDDLKEALNTMMCRKHRRFEMDREPKSAGYFAECNRLHPAEEAESSVLGLKITYLALMDGKVYDITEWAGCQCVGISPNTHRVPYHISFGSRVPGTSRRQRDFLSRIFQVPPGKMSNGNFFSAPHPGPGATAASKPTQRKINSYQIREPEPKRPQHTSSLKETKNEASMAQGNFAEEGVERMSEPHVGS
uniref:J domain-containing protein n=1 Tax=Jaculus jaculus TaxID=51337 RepID=A0A8C5KQS8_JACJA